jgi:hypothetical protein
MKRLSIGILEVLAADALHAKTLRMPGSISHDEIPPVARPAPAAP